MTKPIVIFLKQKLLIFYRQFLCEHSDAFAHKVKLLLYPAERKTPPFLGKASNAQFHIPPSHRKTGGLSVRFSGARHCTLMRQGFNLDIEGLSCLCIIS
jgi:hypothetical protein